jgi:hypothetical protein
MLPTVVAVVTFTVAFNTEFAEAAENTGSPELLGRGKKWRVISGETRRSTNKEQICPSRFGVRRPADTTTVRTVGDAIFFG